MALKMQQSETIRLSKPFCHHYRIVTAPQTNLCLNSEKRDSDKDLGWSLANLGPKPSNLEYARCQKCDIFNFYSKVCVESFPTSNRFLTLSQLIP